MSAEVSRIKNPINTTFKKIHSNSPLQAPKSSGNYRKTSLISSTGGIKLPDIKSKEKLNDQKTGGGASSSVPKSLNPFHMPNDMEGTDPKGVFLISSICNARKRSSRQETGADLYHRLIIITIKAKKLMNNQSIYEKNQPKGKSFKTLLAEDPEDVTFYNSIRKRQADKLLMTRQTRGAFWECLTSNLDNS